MDIFNDFISRQCVKLAVLRNMVLSSKIFEQANSGPFCKLTLYIYRSYGFLILNYLYNQIHFDGITCSVYFIGECEIQKAIFSSIMEQMCKLLFVGYFVRFKFYPEKKTCKTLHKKRSFPWKTSFFV